MQAGLAVKSTVHEAWETIRKVRLGVDCVKEANAERLRWEFSDLTFKPDEMVEDFSLRLTMVEDFSLRLTTVASQLGVLDDQISDKEVIKKLLHVVPDNLEQVAISMKTCHAPMNVEGRMTNTTRYR
jgi:hypothetical protein